MRFIECDMVYVFYFVLIGCVLGFVFVVYCFVLLWLLVVDGLLRFGC